MLILLLGEAAAYTPPLALIAWLGFGATLSIPISYFILPKVQSKLVQGKSSFLDRRPPGGVRFFLSIGAVGGLLAFIVESISGTQILNGLLLLCLSVLISTFTTIGVYVIILEKKHKKKAYLRMPDGLVFLEK